MTILFLIHEAGSRRRIATLFKMDDEWSSLHRFSFSISLPVVVAKSLSDTLWQRIYSSIYLAAYSALSADWRSNPFSGHGYAMRCAERLF